MGSIRIPVPGEYSITQAFSNIPDEAKAMFRRGFSIAVKLGEPQRDVIFSRALDNFEEGATLTASREFQRETGLGEQDLEAVLGAVMLLGSAAAFQATAKTSEDVSSELLKAKLVDPADLPMVEGLLMVFKKRGEEIEARMHRGQLGSRIFPAFRSISTAVDLRLEFADKRLALPVGLVRIGTDEHDEEIKFQVTSVGLKRILRRLNDLQRELGEAERFAPNWEKRPS